MQKDEPVSNEKHGHDSSTAIEDWDELADILKNFPDPNDARIFLNPPPCEDDRYLLLCWWTSYFEKL